LSRQPSPLARRPEARADRAPAGRAGWHPLGGLAALLLLYLAVPIALYLAHLGGTGRGGPATPGLLGAFATSAEAATISTCLIAVLGVPLAYLLARHRGLLSSVASGVVQLPLALPPLMSGVVLLYAVGPGTFLGRLFGGHLTESLVGIVLAQCFVASPFLVVAARSSFAALDANWDETAATLGLSRLARFWRISLPLAGPGVRAGLLMAWLRAFGEYGATVMLAYHPYSLPVFTYVQFSAAGLPAAQLPTALALGTAAVAVAAARIPVRSPRGKRPAVASARPPAPSMPLAVGFDISTTAGTFCLQLSHRARSHRLAILGPSGAGKSLTLRSLAGLVPGEAWFGNERVSQLPPGERRVGYVPQGQSLVPHLSAWENATLGPYADPHLAAWWLAALGLQGLEGYLPSQLSGGQRQRVALARAFSCHPSVVLLDEPFSGLDAPQRAQLQGQLRRLQLQAGLSSVLVTHDASEAAMLADEVLVMAAGRLLQAGPLLDVVRRPATPEVAAVLGARNFFNGVAASARSVRAHGAVIATAHHGLEAGTPLCWSIRPEHVRLVAPGTPGAWPAKALDVVDLGASCLATVQLDAGLELEAQAPALAAGPGERCWAQLPPEAILVWPAPAPQP